MIPRLFRPNLRPATLQTTVQSTFHSSLRLKLAISHQSPDITKIADLKACQAKYSQQLDQYCVKNGIDIPKIELESTIAYRACNDSPESLIKEGGWRSPHDWISVQNSGNSEGTICFTTSLQIATIFLRKKAYKTAYLYAVPLTGKFYQPTGPWSQLFSPGAYPIEHGFYVRELYDFSRDGKSVELREPVLFTCGNDKLKKKSFTENQFRLFLTAKSLVMPEAHSFGCENPLVFIKK